MEINIDPSSGFCWGVVRTVEIAEETLQKEKDKDIYILGQIIHNPKETKRLEEKGLKTIYHEDLDKINPETSKVIIRAHGEPPSTYARAKSKGVEMIDATCPLVAALQNRVVKFYREGYQIVIYGKKDHAEVIGLRGVCNDECIVLKTVEEVPEKVDFTRKTVLISQTTMDKPTFNAIKEAIRNGVEDFVDAGEIKNQFVAKDTLCRAVYGREDKLKRFATDNDIIIFVAGRNSSNGKSLYKVCKTTNEKSYFIEDIAEIDLNWFENAKTVGITGATSTPTWYLREVKEFIENLSNK
jgi:4-hydroxy-3-methylbut-2-enyl diphosphate reductase